MEGAWSSTRKETQTMARSSKFHGERTYAFSPVQKLSATTLSVSSVAKSAVHTRSSCRSACARSESSSSRGESSARQT